MAKRGRKPKTPTNDNNPQTTKARHTVRLHVPAALHTALRHKLADCPPSVTMSELIVEMTEIGLSLNGGA